MTTTQNKTSPPATIIAAFLGFLVSTVAALATAVTLLGAREEILDAMRRANTTGMTEDEMRGAATLAQAFAIGVVVTIALVYLWLSFKLKAGRNWARVLLTLFTLLQVASLFATEGDTAAGYVSCGVAVLALVCSYLPPSNAYVARVRQAR
jgi:glycerol uptake facilitator-like aquaporin